MKEDPMSRAFWNGKSVSSPGPAFAPGQTPRQMITVTACSDCVAAIDEVAACARDLKRAEENLARLNGEIEAERARYLERDKILKQQVVDEYSAVIKARDALGIAQEKLRVELVKP